MNAPSLRELEAVAYLCEHKSYRAAAAHMSISPSALSHTIRGLEARLELRLFNRTTRSVAPTEAGLWLAQQSARIQRELDATLDGLSNLGGGLVGRIRVNAGPLASAALMQTGIVDFLRENKSLQLEIATEGRFVDIVAGGFDAGVRFLNTVPQDMIAVPFGVDVRFVCVASHDYLLTHGEPKHPDELLQHSCIQSRMPSGRRLRWRFCNHDEKLELDVPGQIILNRTDLMISSAEHGLGIAYVPEFEVKSALEIGRLQPVLFDWSEPYDRFALYYPQNKNTPVTLRALANFLRSSQDR